jgi:hypothetical protein
MVIAMKKTMRISICSAAFLAMLVGACGGIDAEHKRHGGVFGVDSIEPAGGSPDIDMVPACPTEDGWVYGTFVREGAVVTLSNLAIGDVAPTELRLEGYEIRYDALDGGPSLTAHSYPYTDARVIPSNGTNSFEVEMIPVKTMREFAKWWDAQNDERKAQTYHYTVEFEFTAVNRYGQRISTTGKRLVTLANFLNDC